MRRAQLRGVMAIGLVAGLLTGCGSEPRQSTVIPTGKVVQGETETGMKLKVESFVSPASAPLLKQLDAYRAAAGYPAVDYHRVTASAGAMPDHPRIVTFASSAQELSVGKGIEGRFGCDVLSFEWVPARTAAAGTFNQLRTSLCAVKPADLEGIAPGKQIVYYLVTDRGFSERDLRARRIFGPRDVEFL
jgi:hypothetical protein